MKLSLAAMTLATCCAALPCGAQNMKPGLWEINNKAQSGSGEMEKAMAKMQQEMASMPPEQRKMVQEMMAKQGVGMAPGGGGGMAVRVCVTREMADRNEMPQQNPGDCKSTSTPAPPSGMKIGFTCANPPSSGEGQITFSGNEAYNMKMTVTSVQQGKPAKMNIEASGKWLGADCGNIKPIVPPKK